MIAAISQNHSDSFALSPGRATAGGAGECGIAQSQDRSATAGDERVPSGAQAPQSCFKALQIPAPSSSPDRPVSDISLDTAQDILEGDLRKVWEFDTGYRQNVAPPHLNIDRDGVMYLLGQGGSRKEGKLYALKDGVTLWEYDTGGEVSPAESPVVGPDSTLYVISHDFNDGKLQAVKDGKKLWDCDLKSPISPPCVGPDGTVYVGTYGGDLIALKDGREMWRTRAGSDMSSSPLVDKDGTVYVRAFNRDKRGSMCESLVCAYRDGEKQWDFRTADVAGTMKMGRDGTIYIDGAADELFKMKLMALKNGGVSWEYPISATAGLEFSIGDDNTIYLGTEGPGGGGVHVIRDGKKLWQCDSTGGVTDAPTLGPDGTIYVSGEDHKIHAIKEGRHLWDFPCKALDSPRCGPDGTVYVGEYGGLVRAVKDGMEVWQYPMGGGFLTAPVIAADGTVLVRSDNGKLCAMAGTAEKMNDLMKEKLARRGPQEKKGPAVIEADEWLIVDGIKIPRKMAYLPGLMLQNLPGAALQNLSGTAQAVLQETSTDLAKRWDCDTGADIITTPCVGGDGTIYVGNSGGSLTAVRDGAKLWEFMAESSIYSSPCAGPDGTVYVGSFDANLYAVHDGHKVWSYKTGGNVSSSPCLGPDGTVYVGSADGNLYALKNGKRLWSYDTGDGIFSSPTLGPDGTIYVGSDNGKLCAIKNGKRLWDFQTGDAIVEKPCLGPDGTVYIGSRDHKLYAVKNGQKVWDYETEGWVESSPCLGPDGTLYAGTLYGRLIAVKDGTLLWEYKTGGQIITSPCLDSDGTVYIGSQDHSLHAVKDGKKLWEYKTGGQVNSSPCLGPDNTVYVGSGDKKLYALVNPEQRLKEKLTQAQEGAQKDPEGIEQVDDWIIVGDVKIPVKK